MPSKEAQAEMSQGLLTGIDLIDRELRLAGYRIPSGSSPIIEMQEREIQFRLDLDDDGDIETVSYRFNSGRSQIQRKVDSGNWAPLVENATDLAFSYRDSSGVPTTNPLSMRRVGIAVTARTFRPDPRWPLNGGYRTYTMEREIYLRN
jgi:hypothetical protein